MRLSPEALAVLADLRQHPHFQHLLKAIPRPRLPQFKISQAEAVEAARAAWIYQSGQANHHDQWMALLTGKAPEPSQQENE